MENQIGIVRRTDELGRIVIPKEFRDSLDIRNGEPLEIFVLGNQIVMEKHIAACTFCGQSDASKLHRLAEKHICNACVDRTVSLPISEVYKSQIWPRTIRNISAFCSGSCIEHDRINRV